MKKTISIILLVLIVFSMFVPGKVKAENASTGHSIEEVGAQIANWSIEFYNKHKNQCWYSLDFSDREQAYNAQINDTSAYLFDCVGWVSFAVHHATGLGDRTFTYFAQPQNPYVLGGFTKINVSITNEQEGKKQGLIPGDILIKSTASGGKHVGIYVGNNQVIHSTGNPLSSNTVAEFASSSNSSGSVIDYIARVSETLAKSANFEFIADGAILPSTPFASGFEFEGMPTNVSYGGSSTVVEWLFDKIWQFFSFLVGMIINLLKYAILGYISLTEKIVSDVLHKVEETQATSNINYIQYAYEKNINIYPPSFLELEKQEFTVKPIKAYSSNSSSSQITIVDSEDRYTIEDIIFNHIPILDVNVFANKPGGKDISTKSIVEIIRTTVATWYVSFRNLAIMALAVIVLYIGIRIALSTIPEKTGQYKTALGSWIASIVLIFVIHYFMIIVFNINDTLVSIFENASSNANTNEISIYETIVTRALDTRMSIGIPATIIYAVLVIYFIKFLFIYFKRYFTIMILIIIAPFICAKYAFDSAKGKRGTSLTSWMYDLTLNTLLQSVHALLYTVFMGIAVNLAVSSVWGFILALVFINFILKADKIFMQIFKFSRGASVGDVDKEFSKEDIAGAIVAYAYTKDALKYGWKGAKSLSKRAGRMGNSAYNTGLRAIYGNDAEKKAINNRNWIDSKLNKVDNWVGSNAKKFGFEGTSEKAQLRVLSRQGGEIGRGAKRTLQKKKDLRNKRFKSTMKIAKGIPLGIGGMLAGIPMFVVSPKAGYAMMSKGYKQYRELSKPKTDIPGYKTKYHGKAIIAQIATLGAYGVVHNARKDEEKQQKDEGKIGKTIEFIKQVDGSYDLAKEKWNEMSQNMNDKEKNTELNKIKTKVVECSETNISRAINNYLNTSGEKEINIDNVEDVMYGAIDALGIEENYTNKQIESLVEELKDSFNGSNYEGKDITEQVKNLSKDMHEKIMDIEKPINIEGDNTNTFALVSETMETNSQERIDDTNIDNVLDVAMNGAGIYNNNYSKDTIQEITDKVKANYHYDGASRDEQVNNLIREINSTVKDMNNKIEKNNDLARIFDKIEDVNQKAKKDVKTTIVDTDRLITEMRIKHDNE